MPKTLTKEEAWDLAQEFRNSLKIQNEIGFGDMNIKAPDIDFYSDNDQYFDPQGYLIHIGVFGLVDLFRCKTEAEFLNALNYVRGHEEQHCRCTATRPYQLGIERGCEKVLEYISSQVDTSKRRFKSQSDYADFANRILPSKGIYISYSMVRQIIAGIANSIEDGRIERIRAFRFPGYEKLRLIHRGIFWDRDNEMQPYDAIKNNAAAKLTVIVNEILSLATCQLYCKGFVAAYGDTPLLAEVNALMPYIGRGIMASRTRDMAEEVEKISAILAPYIYEVCRMSEQDMQMRKALEALLSAMISAMVDAEPANELSEGNEDTEEGCSGSTFPTSDLVITLPDDVYDKMVEKNKKRGSEGGGGVMVQREHPKEEEQNEDGGQSGAGSGSGQGQDGEQQASGSGQGQDASESSKNAQKGGSDGKADKQSTEQSEGNSDGKNGRGDAGKKHDGNPSNSTSSSKTPGNGPGGRSDRSGNIDAVKKAMREAAEKMNEEANREIDNINISAQHADKMKGKVVEDTSKPLTEQDVRALLKGQGFKEVKREYKLTERLPAVLAARGRTMLRKNQQYFKSLSTPNVSFLDSGSVDPSRIYGLSFGDTEIFRKKGIDKKFDGCVYILIDNSGSMSGNKRIEACKAAAVIEESFRGLIPIKIVAFDDSCMVVHEVIKGWDEQQKLNCCWNYCVKGRAGGGTPTAESVKIATKEILARPESKKLIIVLTDGEPNDREETKKAIQEARKKNVSVAGIYFEEGEIGRAAASFNHIFDGRDIIATELSMVDQELSALMKKFSRS